jgi:Family of unknown function (DUF6519)/Right handed beta helix region
MRGDFSIWRDERRQNFNGVLHQQGRVLLDADWNAQTNLTNDWQDTAGRDIIGAGVAAVPADAPDSFKIKAATVSAANVDLTVAPGRVWADGLLAYIDGTADVQRLATYLEPPFQTNPPAPALGTDGTRDAVVLEVWREEINGFQIPQLLIEPALGGPDTTERVHTGLAFRLFRMTDPNDTCESIVDDLQDNFAAKGKLTVTLDDPPPPAGDCPLIAGSGYTGFEHNLYRIEIAAVDSGIAPSFKWSQFGGGLVGRGQLQNAPAPATITITANQQAIINSGLSQFYMEIVSFDSARGHWRVAYGANVTLGSNGTLTLPNPSASGSPGVFFGSPPPNGIVFFRLWNAIELISAFDDVNPLPLQDGILLKFDAAVGANYVAGDYWTFSVRAGDISNLTPLINNLPPEGIHYHRVPLGIIEWDAAPPPVIEDCRRVFQPLTRLATCCTYRVGDGMHSHGDFRSIQAAVTALPPSGGEICVLPGEYVENVVINNRHDITIKGCGPRTRVIAPADPPAPVFHVTESQNIQILSLAIEAHEAAAGILLDGRPAEVIAIEEQGEAPLVNVTLENLHVRAATRAAIQVEVGYNITIRRCNLEMRDVPTGWPALFLAGEDSLIEENYIHVESENRIEGVEVLRPLDPVFFDRATDAIGGMQLGGGCERIRVISNVIVNGLGTGIVLGSLLVTTTEGVPLPEQPDRPIDDCGDCGPGDTVTTEPEDPETTIRSAGPLYDILIEDNRIFHMGLNGIGVITFFSLEEIDEFITVIRLIIKQNEIRRCLWRELAENFPMRESMGYGGIALADVEHLTIRDNFIIDNGPDFREPGCGIFVLHGEGIDISRNHVLNNGAKPADPQENPPPVKRGQRGGINILFALAPTVEISILQQTVPAHAGFPAVTIHDNIVAVPVGRALSLMALGPVSVQGNQLTSNGVSFDITDTLIAGTVAILNLGITSEFFLQYIVFAMASMGAAAGLNEGRPGLDDRTLGLSLTNGNVLFNDNQVELNLSEAGISFALTSIFIFSLDDVGFQNNQCDLNMLDDLVLAHALIGGISVRVSDNRFKDPSFFNFRQLSLPFSAITIGLFMNTTTDNQSTHCLWIIGPNAYPHLTVDHSNVSLATMLNPTACCGFLMHEEECFKGKGTDTPNPG